ncbi:PEP-CTERM protein-sorting domain-containing protein [Streptomyces sp. cf386]|nr:PEP-CTERM protein-sorting domain-containing protein [Streptomyces sp. cf386]
MRLRTPVPLCLAAATLLAAAPPVRAEPQAELPSCATPDRDFPLATRLHGGPDSYTAGGGFGTWYLDLTNTTERTCTGIHPVVVLVDGKNALKPSQPRLEFYGTQDGTQQGARPLPVRFETTDQNELVGAFDGFPGFTVGPRKTVTVKVRLALTSDAVPNEVIANAAVVQRHEGDGDWVGQSNDYRFAIEADPTGAATTPSGTTAPTDQDASAAPGIDGSRNQLTFADELARTGLASRPGAILAATVSLLLIGAGFLLVRRRR